MSASPGKYCIKNTELGPGSTPELMNPSPEEEYQGLHLTEFGYSRYSAMTSESLGWDLGLGIFSDCTVDSTVQTSLSTAGAEPRLSKRGPWPGSRSITGSLIETWSLSSNPPRPTIGRDPWVIGVCRMVGEAPEGLAEQGKRKRRSPMLG